MFDRQFQQLWSAASVEIHRDQRLGEGEGEDGGAGHTSILVTWEDCIMADYFTKHNPRTVLEYTVEISPETEVSDMKNYFNSLTLH